MNLDRLALRARSQLIVIVCHAHMHRSVPSIILHIRRYFYVKELLYNFDLSILSSYVKSSVSVVRICSTRNTEACARAMEHTLDVLLSVPANCAVQLTKLVVVEANGCCPRPA